MIDYFFCLDGEATIYMTTNGELWQKTYLADTLELGPDIDDM